MTFDTPYRVERTMRRLGDVSYGFVYEIVRTGEGALATVHDVALVYKIVDLLNEDHHSAAAGRTTAGDPAQPRSL